MYGATEATARMAYLPPHLAQEYPQAIGVPIPGATLTIEPLDGALGAVATGVDLSQPLDTATAERLRRAWLEHLVLVMPDQRLDLNQLEAVALAFGPFGVDPFLGSIDGHPHVAEVKRTAEETSSVFAEAWHSDWSFLASPPAGTMLRSSH